MFRTLQSNYISVRPFDRSSAETKNLVFILKKILLPKETQQTVSGDRLIPLSYLQAH